MITTVSPPVAPFWPWLPVLPVSPVAPVLPVFPVFPVAPAGPGGPGTVTTAGVVTTVGRSQAAKANAAIESRTTGKRLTCFMEFPLCWVEKSLAQNEHATWQNPFLFRHKRFYVDL